MWHQNSVTMISRGFFAIVLGLVLFGCDRENEVGKLDKRIVVLQGQLDEAAKREEDLRKKLKESQDKLGEKIISNQVVSAENEKKVRKECEEEVKRVRNECDEQKKRLENDHESKVKKLKEDYDKQMAKKDDDISHWKDESNKWEREAKKKGGQNIVLMCSIPLVLGFALGWGTFMGLKARADVKKDSVGSAANGNIEDEGV